MRFTSGRAARSGPLDETPREKKRILLGRDDVDRDVTAPPELRELSISFRFDARGVSSSRRAKRPRRERRVRRELIAKLLRCMTTEASPRHALYTPTGAGSPPDARKNPSIYFTLSPSPSMVLSYLAGSSFLRYFVSLDLCPRSIRNPRWVA